jgi:hypothetical protein
MNSKKWCLVTLFLYFGFYLLANIPERPLIWVKSADRPAILHKIEEKPWARDIYNDFINQINTDIQLHKSNPEEFIKALPFNWEKAKPGETPPFYHTHHIENGENRNLDNTTDEEWINGKKLIRYLQLGLDCGIAYYLTEDEKYAQCAVDILNAFVNGVLQSEVSDWKGRGGWLFPYDGFREVREIGYKVPLIYDFTAGFIKKGGKPFDIILKTKTDFPLDKAQAVFRTYADISVNYGMTDSNHPVLEAPSLVYNAMAIEDEKEREKLLSYFLTENTENQDALTVMASMYKNEGDIWPETSQYFNHVSTILTRLMRIVNKYNPSLRLGEKYSNVLFSLPALDYMVYPNGEIIRWGDGHREGTPSFASYEDAYLLGKMDGSAKITDKFAPLLKKAFEEGKYKRKGIESVLWYNDEYGGETAKFEFSRTDVVPHAGIFLQRNLSASGKPEDGLMCFVGGAHMVHGHAEGMNIELYGCGHVLGVDNGRGRYQQEIHENYSRIFAAHNTVIVNGNSQGEGGWANLGINTVQLVTMEPMPRAEAISPNHSFSVTSFTDDKGDKAEAYQERTLALIRTSETTGYYVDVFRSKSELPNQFHDYLYHNIGDSLVFLNKDLLFKPTPERFMANANLLWKQNQYFRNPGWHNFEDVKTSVNYAENVHVRFEASHLAENSVFMDLHIPGFDQREYSEVKAPHTFEAPQYYLEKPTPTMVIRKSGEAWIEPFVVVFEPFSANEKSIVSVEKLTQNGMYKGVKVTSVVNQEKLIQYIVTLNSNESYEDRDSEIFFNGIFTVITTNEKNELRNIYLGNAKNLQFKNVNLSFREGASNAFVDWKNGKPVIYSKGILEIEQN